MFCFQIIVALLVGFLPHILRDLGIISFPLENIIKILFLHINLFTLKLLDFCSIFIQLLINVTIELLNDILLILKNVEETEEPEDKKREEVISRATRSNGVFRTHMFGRLHHCWTFQRGSKEGERTL